MIPSKRAGVRLKFERSLLMVEVKDAGDASYRPCNSQPLVEGNFNPMLMVTASN
jgi:hypothetical protein